MLKRKLYQVLLNWKKRRNECHSKETLILKGARQVGKTSLVQEFGTKEYDSFIEINFVLHPELKEVFSSAKDADTILTALSLHLPNMKLIPGKTLLFLDEIQNCGAARTAVKFLAGDFRFDCISSGSLLGLEYGMDADKNVEVPESLPVGFETPVNMYSLDFEEYLWALGYQERQIDVLKQAFESDTPLSKDIHEKFEQIFRQFMIVGGMPEVVQTFVRTLNYNDAFAVQEKIISDYQDDISKHAKGDQKIKVRACYDSIPRQLAKESKKFQYGVVEKGQTRRKFGDSIQWLKDSSMVNVCRNVSQPYLPLMANEISDQFKLYFNDTGLLTFLYGRATKIALMNDTLKGNAKGAIYENIISECLVKRGYSLHYYKPDDTHELEFLLEQDCGVVPVEVKAGNNASVSLNDFIEKNSPEIAYKIISGNLGVQGIKKVIPHYMVMFL